MDDGLQCTQHMCAMPMQTCNAFHAVRLLWEWDWKGAVTALAFWKSALASEKTRVIASRQYVLSIHLYSVKLHSSEMSYEHACYTMHLTAPVK